MKDDSIKGPYPHYAKAQELKREWLAREAGHQDHINLGYSRERARKSAEQGGVGPSSPAASTAESHRSEPRDS